MEKQNKTTTKLEILFYNSRNAVGLCDPACNERTTRVKG